MLAWQDHLSLLTNFSSPLPRQENTPLVMAGHIPTALGTMPLVAAGYMHLASMMLSYRQVRTERKSHEQANISHSNNPPTLSTTEQEAEPLKGPLANHWHLHQNKGGTNTKPGEKWED